MQRGLPVPLAQCNVDLSPDAGGEVLEIKLQHNAESDMIVYSYLLTHPHTLLKLTGDFQSSFFREQSSLLKRRQSVQCSDKVESQRIKLEKKEMEITHAKNEIATMLTKLRQAQQGEVGVH